MVEVRCQIIRWVADEPFPGLVEARLIDIDGRSWTFIDKDPIFSKVGLSRGTKFPVDGAIRCELVKRDVLGDGQEVVTVDTGRPDGVEAVDGATHIRVFASDLVT